MKKKLIVFLVVVLALSSLLVACGKEKGDGVITLVVDMGEPVEYEVNLSDVSGNKGVFSVLEYLKENKKLTFEYSGTDDTAYLTKINDFVSGTDGYYIYIYTSVEKDFDVSDYKQTVKYKEKTLTSSGVGASQMTLEDKAIIYIGRIQWS